VLEQGDVAMFDRRANGLRTLAIRIAFLSIGVLMAATTAGALSRPNDELLPAAIERTPQAAIDEEFAILRAYSIDIGRAERPQIDSCGNFQSSFLNPKCGKIHKRRVARVRRVATYVPAGSHASE
jgi:hypothetical protein